MKTHEKNRNYRTLLPCKSLNMLSPGKPKTFFLAGRLTKKMRHKFLLVVIFIYLSILISGLSTLAWNPKALNLITDLDLPVSTVQYTQLTRHCDELTDAKEPNISQDVPRNRTLLTLFTSFKDRRNRFMMHSYVMKNWASLGPEVRLILFTTTRNDSMLEKMAKNYGWTVLPAPGINKFHTPFIKAMYKKAYEMYDSDFYAYANGDILFSQDIIRTLEGLKQHFAAKKMKSQEKSNSDTPFIVGQRKNFILDFRIKSLVNGVLWHPHNVYCVVRSKDALAHREDALDYFVTTKDYPWHKMPDFVIGRIGYDQYLLLQARFHNLSTIDVTLSNPVLHLQGANGQMAHNMDKNKDAKFNMKLLKTIHPKGIPWFISNTTTTEFYTKVGHSDLVVTTIELKTRSDYEWPSLHPYFDKYRTIETFNDEHVLQNIY